MYPLKSGFCMEVKEAECTIRGFKEITDDAESKKFLFIDRGFLIYRENSQKFMTARQRSATLLINISSNNDNTITLSSIKSVEKSTFNIPDGSTSKTVQCSLHEGEIVDAQDCGDEVALWLSKVILGKDVGIRLGFYPEQSKERQLFTGLFKDYIKVYNFTENDLGAFSDVASYMVLSQPSVDDLNSRLAAEDRITSKHFRPNIVVSGPEIAAYDEDNWEWLKIGDNVILKGFKPCVRCIMVTMDPEKGKANPKREPIVTLKKYRQVTDPAKKEIEGSCPIFGRYCGLYRTGNISVGDTVYVPA